MAAGISQCESEFSSLAGGRAMLSLGKPAPPFSNSRRGRHRIVANAERNPVEIRRGRVGWRDSLPGHSGRAKAHGVSQRASRNRPESITIRGRTARRASIVRHAQRQAVILRAAKRSRRMTPGERDAATEHRTRRQTRDLDSSRRTANPLDLGMARELFESDGHGATNVFGGQRPARGKHGASVEPARRIKKRGADDSSAPQESISVFGTFRGGT